MIYHITTREEWDAAAESGSYAAASLSDEGFIHCSDRNQVLDVANFLFRGRTGLLLLALQEDRVPHEIRRENLEGGTTLFPHVYGAIPTEAVVAVADFAAGPDGSFAWPDALP